MKKLIFSSLVLSSSLISVDMTLEELEQEHKKLQLQIKNAQMKQQLKEMEQKTITPPPSSRR